MKAKPCYDGRTCRNEMLVEDLIDVLEVASAALRQYQSGKTWPHIATDALEEIEKVVGKNERETSTSH